MALDISKKSHCSLPLLSLPGRFISSNCWHKLRTWCPWFIWSLEKGSLNQPRHWNKPAALRCWDCRIKRMDGHFGLGVHCLVLSTWLTPPSLAKIVGIEKIPEQFRCIPAECPRILSTSARYQANWWPPDFIRPHGELQRWRQRRLEAWATQSRGSLSSSFRRHLCCECSRGPGPQVARKLGSNVSEMWAVCFISFDIFWHFPFDPQTRLEYSDTTKRTLKHWDYNVQDLRHKNCSRSEAKASSAFALLFRRPWSLSARHRLMEDGPKVPAFNGFSPSGATTKTCVQYLILRISCIIMYVYTYYYGQAPSFAPECNIPWKVH